MKTALLFISQSTDSLKRYLYLKACVNKVIADNCEPIIPAFYDSESKQKTEQFVNTMLPMADLVYMFVDYGIDQVMFDIIDRAVASKIELKYCRISPSAPALCFTPVQILYDVAKKTGISILVLQSKSRMREIVDARFIYCRLAKELCKSSLSQIGSVINRDHASVLHGIREANENKEVLKLYNTLYAKTKVETPSLGSDSNCRATDRQPVERPVLPYRSMDKGEQVVQAAEPALCTMQQRGYHSAFGGYRPQNT